MNNRYPQYPNDADYQTNAPSYYEDLARKQKLIEMLAKKIWEYENTLNETLEQIEQRLTDYILENDSLMSERLENWDKRIEEMPEEMRSLFVTWLNDGTLEEIINHDVLGNKADQSELDKTNEQLAQTAYYPLNETELKLFVDTTEQRTINIGKLITVTEDLYIPKNIRLVFRQSGLLNVLEDTVVTIDGYIDAEHYQIFDFENDTSIVTTTNIGTYGETEQPTNIQYNVKVAWFGAKGDAVPPVTVDGLSNGVLPTGTNDTDAIKRAVDFANKASVKGTIAKQKDPMVTLELQPNSTYLVVGDNILGAQSDNYVAIFNQIEGNGAQFLHVILSDEDSLISNGFIMGVPVFKDFSVDVYIENGVQYQTRKGTFFNLNSKGRTPIKMIRAIFDQIRVSANSDEFGYENIFKIDGNQMTDNGLVNNGYYATFKHFFNSSNNEAVNWKFENNYIHPSTENSVIYLINGVTSGPLKSHGNEIRFNNDGETYLKTVGNARSGGVFELTDRVEMRGNLSLTLFDLDYGKVKVKGQNYYAGAGGFGLPKSDSLIAKIGPHATLTLEDCMFPMANVLIKKINEFTNSDEEMLTVSNSTINNKTVSGYPYLLFENTEGTRLTLENIFDNNFHIKQVKVLNPRGTLNYFDSEYGTKKTEIKKMIVSGNTTGGNNYVVDTPIRIPYNFTIEQIKLFNGSHSTANIDGIRVRLYYPNSETQSIFSKNITLDGSKNFGKELLTNEIITVTNSNVILEFYFLKDNEIVTSKVPSYAEIEYRGVQKKHDISGATGGIVRKEKL